MWVSLFIAFIIIMVVILLLSISYRDGYHRAYVELTESGMSHKKAKVISSIMAFFYIF